MTVVPTVMNGTTHTVLRNVRSIGGSGAPDVDDDNEGDITNTEVYTESLGMKSFS